MNAMLKSYRSFFLLLFCECRYTGADCSERQCTYGIDPLWIDDTTARVTQTAVRFKTVDANTLAGEYAIKFYDVFGEDYITQPLALSATGSGHCADVKKMITEFAQEQGNHSSFRAEGAVYTRNPVAETLGSGRGS